MLFAYSILLLSKIISTDFLIVAYVLMSILSVYYFPLLFIVYISPNATSSSWSPPGPVTLEESEGTYFSFYDEQAIAATFHTHLIEGGSEQLFSRADLYNQTACYPNCDLIILYNCNAYVYTFEHGMYIP